MAEATIGKLNRLRKAANLYNFCTGRISTGRRMERIVPWGNPKENRKKVMV
jgi:hypothetical protein